MRPKERKLMFLGVAISLKWCEPTQRPPRKALNRRKRTPGNHLLGHVLFSREEKSASRNLNLLIGGMSLP